VSPTPGGRQQYALMGRFACDSYTLSCETCGLGIFPFVLHMSKSTLANTCTTPCHPQCCAKSCSSSSYITHASHIPPSAPKTPCIASDIYKQTSTNPIPQLPSPLQQVSSPPCPSPPILPPNETLAVPFFLSAASSQASYPSPQTDLRFHSS
jgi:hypothetical protein